MLSQYLAAIIEQQSQIRASSPDFPNFFAGLPHEYSLLAIEKYIQSVLTRTRVSHIHEGANTNEFFFRHLAEYALKLAAESECGIDIDLYVGGGVVRSLLGYTYKYLHQQYMQSENEALRQDNPVPNKPFQNEVAAYFSTILKSPEYKLTAGAIRETTPLLSPFVLGVGSDLDIYLDVMSKDGAPLTQAQKAASETIRQELVNYINALEIEAGLRDNKQSIKHSILPVADVKIYAEQMERTLSQGGSLLDTLAFRLTPKRSKEDGWFKMPRGFEKTLDNFLDGSFEYVAPEQGEASHKQSIRGLRALLEIPFLNIKNTEIISTELLNILNLVKQGQAIDPQAIEQFQKMVRNANFEQAHNRAHLVPEGTPLNLGLQISDRGSPNDGKLKRLMPTFLQRLKIDSPLTLKEGKWHHILSQHFMKKENFIATYTDKGAVYHGTSPEIGMSVLRGGFVESTNKQGTAVYGPGAYVANSHAAAAGYSTGLVLRLKIADENLNIIKQEDVQKYWQALEQEATEKGFITQNQPDATEGIYTLLRDRTQYAIDIIIATNNEYLVVQNLNALKLSESLESMLAWLYSPLDKWMRGEAATESEFEVFDNQLKEYKNFYTLLKNMGADLSNSLAPEDIWKTNIGTVVITDGPLQGCSLSNFGTTIIQNGDYKERFGLIFLILKDYIELAKLIIEKSQATLHNIITESSDTDRTALLIFAIKAGRTDIIQSLIEKDSATLHHVITTGVNKGHSALTLAIHEGRTQLAQWIVEKDPATLNHVITDGYNKGDTALTVAIKKGCTALVQWIIKKDSAMLHHVITDGYDKGHTALTWAIKYRQTKLAQWIIEKEPATLNHVITDGYNKGDTALTVAIKKGCTALVQWIIEKEPATLNHVITDGYDKSHTTLTLAIEYSNTELAQWIIEKDPATLNHVITDGYDKKGLTALTLAIRSGHTQLAQWIIEKDPETLNHVITNAYNYAKGLTALTLAISEGHSQLAQWIIEKDPATLNHVITDGYDRKSLTALTWAIKKGHTELAQWIIEKEPTTLNHVITDGYNKGDTALTVAIAENKTTLAQWIIEKNPTTLHYVITEGNHKGHTALTLAIKIDEAELVRFIQTLQSESKVAQEPEKAKNNNALIFSPHLKQGVKRKNDDIEISSTHAYSNSPLCTII